MEKELQRKELKVSAIENGTVIDHIPSGSVFQVIKILNLAAYQDQLLVATNLDSRKMGKKGIIKVSNRFFKSDEINKIAAVGIAVKSGWITMHGFALNVSPNMDHYKMIIACGIRDKGVTSMSAVLGREVDIADVKKRLVGQMAKNFF